MIAGLEEALEGAGQPDLTELRGFLAELLGGRQAQGRLVEQRTLPSRALRVYRLRFEINGQIRTVVVKRHPGYVDPDFSSSYLVERETELCDPIIRQVVTERSIQLISHRQAASLLAALAP